MERPAGVAASPEGGTAGMEAPSAKVGRMKPGRWWSVLAAASILVAVALAWLLLLRPSEPQILADRYIRQNLGSLSVTMGEPDSLQVGLMRYNAGKYREALQQFERIVGTDPSNISALLDAGIVSLRLENYDKALDYFHKTQNHTDARLNPALFYEALTLLKRNHAGDAAHAKLLLKRIVQEDLNMKGAAADLLGKL